jgi:hypothetical protein
MSDLAERLRKVRKREVDPIGYNALSYDLWPELCAVVEAAEHRGKHAPEGWCAEAVAALARRMDEEGL